MTQLDRLDGGWGVLFWMAFGGLLLLAVGLAITGPITDLFARNQELDWIGLGLAISAAVSLIIIGVREIFGLMRLVTVENLRERGAKMIVSDDRVEGLAIALGELTSAFFGAGNAGTGCYPSATQPDFGVAAYANNHDGTGITCISECEFS
jgi:uncharacterized membrane protein YcjF (UPF0283 family)